jgi:hypothetical protein
MRRLAWLACLLLAAARTAAQCTSLPTFGGALAQSTAFARVFQTFSQE